MYVGVLSPKNGESTGRENAKLNGNRYDLGGHRDFVSSCRSTLRLPRGH